MIINFICKGFERYCCSSFSCSIWWKSYD